MPAPSVTVEPADRAARDRLGELLAANDLPSQDVRTSPGRFFVIRDGTRVIGGGGIETNGSDGLLRSVVVAESSRGQGYGTVLCDVIEADARTEGVETLYLLTTTATSFFRGRGYEAIAREAAPSRIRETTEFAERCPRSATCLRKQIGGEIGGGKPREAVAETGDRTD